MKLNTFVSATILACSLSALPLNQAHAMNFFCKTVKIDSRAAIGIVIDSIESLLPEQRQLGWDYTLDGDLGLNMNALAHKITKDALVGLPSQGYFMATFGLENELSMNSYSSVTISDLILMVFNSATRKDCGK